MQAFPGFLAGFCPRSGELWANVCLIAPQHETICCRVDYFQCKGEYDIWCDRLPDLTTKTNSSSILAVSRMQVIASQRTRFIMGTAWTCFRTRTRRFDLTVFSPPYSDILAITRAIGPSICRNWVVSCFAPPSPGRVVAVVIGDGTKNFAKSLTSFRLAVEWCDRAGWRLFETCIYYRDGLTLGLVETAVPRGSRIHPHLLQR